MWHARLAALCPPFGASRSRRRGRWAGRAGAPRPGGPPTLRARAPAHGVGAPARPPRRGARPRRRLPVGRWAGRPRRGLEGTRGSRRGTVRRRRGRSRPAGADQRGWAVDGPGRRLPRGGPGHGAAPAGARGRGQRRVEPALGPLPLRSPGGHLGAGRLARAALLLQHRRAPALRSRGDGGRAGGLRPRPGGARLRRGPPHPPLLCLARSSAPDPAAAVRAGGGRGRTRTSRQGEPGRLAPGTDRAHGWTGDGRLPLDRHAVPVTRRPPPLRGDRPPGP